MLKTLSEMNRQRYAPALALFCIVLAIFNSSYGAVTPQRGGRRGRVGRDSEPDSIQSAARQAQEQKRQQALENAAEAIDTGLVEMLNLVNEQRRPGKKKLASAQQTVQKSRKYIKQFQDNMVCQFMMLNAWTNYFEAGAEKAHPTATQAYRKDQSNNDARATQAAIAVLAGRKPLVIRPQRQRAQADEAATGRGGTGRMGRGATTGRQTRGRSGGQDTLSGRGRGGGRTGPGADYTSGTAGSSSGTVSSGSILNLDADSIKADWHGRKVGPFSLNCLNGTTFSYNPAEANLCVLFWRLAAEDLGDYADFEGEDPNGPERTAPIRERPSYPSGPDRMRMARAGRSSRMGGRMGGRMAFGQDLLADEGAGPGDPVSQQMSALGNIFNSKFQHPEVKFIGINTNSPRTAPAVVARLLQSPMPWAQAMLNSPAVASAFSTLDLEQLTFEQPVLAVVDKTGTVKYAGPAAGFLAPMVLNNITGRATIPSEITGDSHKAQEAMEQQTTEAMAGALKQMSESMSEGMENMDQQVWLQTSESTEITPEDYQAQKLLAYAQGLFIPAGKKKFFTSKTGVDLCRQIISQYPNTTYADEARKLLRTVPPNEQKRYNITPEEMGL